MMLIKRFKISFLLFICLLFFIEPVFADIGGRYFMDGNPGRVIMITPLEDDLYRVEEPTSPWPWSGAAKLTRSWIDGIARFDKHLGTFMIHGEERSDGSIKVSYVFLTDKDNRLLDKIGPGGGRIDNHIWYKAK
jgi:hypothetical protein